MSEERRDLGSIGNGIGCIGVALAIAAIAAAIVWNLADRRHVAADLAKSEVDPTIIACIMETEPRCNGMLKDKR